MNHRRHRDGVQATVLPPMRKSQKMPQRSAEASRTVIRASTTAHSGVLCLLQLARVA
jgi:hypothetical protein